MKNKLIILFFTLLSFFTFSCKSTDIEELENQIETPTEDISNQELSNQENSIQEDEPTLEEETTLKLDSEDYNLPAQMIEPPVYDLELPKEEETPISDNQFNNEDITEENIIIEEEIIPEIIEIEDEIDLGNNDDVIDIEEIESNEFLENPENIEEIIDNNLALTDNENLDPNEIEKENEIESNEIRDTQEQDDILASETEESESEIENKEENVKAEIIPSRKVTLNRGETLEIVYPGSGWIYIGSLAEYNNLKSRGRRLGQADTKYTLLASEEGTQIHHFYKIDNLTGEYIDDYIEVEVLAKKGNSKTIVKAPEYSQIVPKKPESPAKSSISKKLEEIENQNQVENDISTSMSQSQDFYENHTISIEEVENSNDIEEKNQPYVYTEDNDLEVIDISEEYDTSSDGIIFIDSQEILENAKEAFKNKNYEEAFNHINDYLNQTTDKIDEALYLLGQILEADSAIKNIKEAVNSYKNIIENFPTSNFWEKAKKRLIYLKRFYLEAR